MEIISIKEFEELKQLNKARYKFYKTIKFLEDEIVYTPPKQMGWSWIFDYKDFTVQEDTEKDCYIKMQKKLSKHINSMIKRGEMTV